MSKPSGSKSVAFPARDPNLVLVPESELSNSDSEIDEAYNVTVKDSARQARTLARSRQIRPQADNLNIAPGDEPSPEAEALAHTSKLFLAASAYRQGTRVTQHVERSYYIPDCSSLFLVSAVICDLIISNQLLHELSPAFTSLAFQLYIGHLYFYHILRVRKTANVLNRVEIRVLKRYEKIGPPNSWPIPTPIIGILQSYGLCIPTSGFYGMICPTLPIYDDLKTSKSLFGLATVKSVLRAPLIPHLQEFLYNYGSNEATYIGDTLYPVANNHLDEDEPYLGLISSEDTSQDFQILAFHPSSTIPAENEFASQAYPDSAKRAFTADLNIPQIGSTTRISDLEKFLGFIEGEQDQWLEPLLTMASVVTRFFPGSVTLNDIQTSTQEEMFTAVTWTSPDRRSPTTARWNHPRENWTYSLNGLARNERSEFLFKVASSASPNANFTKSVYPSICPALTHSPRYVGPYFVNARRGLSRPLALVHVLNDFDPLRNAFSLMESRLYLSEPPSDANRQV
jgi:hypothetical protein